MHLCYCRLHCRALRATKGTSPENRSNFRHPLTAVRNMRSSRQAAEPSRCPFTLLPPPAPGGPDQLTVGGGLQCLQWVNKTRWLWGRQRGACMQHTEGTQDSTSCHRAGWHCLSYNKNCVDQCVRMPGHIYIFVWNICGFKMYCEDISVSLLCVCRPVCVQVTQLLCRFCSLIFI